MPNIGCSNGLFTTKTLLNMRKNHNSRTIVAFLNMVKNFDVDGHKLLIKVLKRYGAIPKFSLMFIYCIKTC